MNEEATNTVTETVTVSTVAKLSDAELAALLASKPESAQVTVAEADEEAPTIH